jgi:hypothetical protein
MKLSINATKRAGVAAVLTAVVAVGGGLFAAAPASAAAGVLEICSKGTYATNVEFVDQGGSSSYNIQSGHCYKLNVGTSTRVEKIYIFGHVNTAKWLVAVGSLRPSKGGLVYTYGTPQQSWALTPAV